MSDKKKKPDTKKPSKNKDNKQHLNKRNQQSGPRQCAPQQNMGPYPSQQNMGPYPSQQNMGPYPPQQNMRPYLSQQNMGPYPPQQNMGNYPPQQNMGNYPPQQNMGNYPPQQNMGSYPPQQNMGNYPPQQNMGNYPQQNMGNYPPQQNMGNYPPQQNMGNYPPQQNMNPYPTEHNMGHYSHQGMQESMCPPPSYEDSVKQDKPKSKNKNKKTGRQNLKKKTKNQNFLDPSVLVETLSKFKGSWSKLSVVCKQLEFSEDVVKATVHQHRFVFATFTDKDSKETMIELCPKLSICHYHNSSKGCGNRKCRSLHICRFWVMSNCRCNNDCNIGHNWYTEHNKKILNHYFIRNISGNNIKDLVKKRIKPPVPTVCRNYNSDACKFGSERCNYLHVCLQYVLQLGVKCPASCTYNHNIKEMSCAAILRKAQISLNEAPKDILIKLANANKKFKKLDDGAKLARATSTLSICSEDSLMSDFRGRDYDSTENWSSNEENSDDYQDDDDDDDESDCSDFKDTASMKSNKQRNQQDSDHDEDCEKKGARSKIKAKSQNTNKKDAKKGSPDENKQPKSKTVNTQHLLGNVENNYVCASHLTQSCEKAKEGCLFLHSQAPFHWQFYHDSNWYNMTFKHSKCLEMFYTKASNEQAELLPLEAKPVLADRPELYQLLGSNKLLANLEEMMLNCGDKMYYLRRISTKSFVAFTDKKSTIFQWYIKDPDDSEWTTLDMAQSNLVERHFLDSPEINLQVNLDSDSMHIIDFEAMTAIARGTQIIKNVRRRPAGIAEDILEEFKPTKSKNDSKPKKPKEPEIPLPFEWSQKGNKSEVKLVKLEENDAEFNEAALRILRNIPGCKVSSVLRVENPKIWRTFKKNIASLNGEEGTLVLFHAVIHSQIPSIVQDNFDWKLHDCSWGYPFGRGTYFTNNAFVARSQSDADEDGKKFIVISLVYIGNIEKGDQTMEASDKYNTTVDDLSVPQMFVKYSSNEYYPQYIVAIE